MTLQCFTCFSWTMPTRKYINYVCARLHDIVLNKFNIYNHLGISKIKGKTYIMFKNSKLIINGAAIMENFKHPPLKFPTNYPGSDPYFLEVKKSGYSHFEHIMINNKNDNFLSDFQAVLGK